MGSMVVARLPHRLILGLLTALAALTIALPAGAPPVAARSGWDGSFDLYRRGTFTTQKSWLWCTAAGVQIVRNVVERDDDHSTASQRRYFEWMRRHNRYDLPLSAGVDAAGWTAGMRQFVDDRYRLVVSTSFDGALRLAVKRMRLTNLPVALTVDQANHAWILTGFSATADPATTDEFSVTSVRVVGPLYGLQSRTYGYDMKPGTSLTTKQLRHFFTPWWYTSKRMIWDHKYVSIQPVPVKAAATPATPKPTLSPVGSPSPPVPSIASPSIAASLEDPSSSPFDAAAVILPATPDGSTNGAQTAPVRPPRIAPTSTVSEVESGVVVAVVGLLVAVAVGIGLIARSRAVADGTSHSRSTRSVR
jgi:hypothetical protein